MPARSCRTSRYRLSAAIPFVLAVIGAVAGASAHAQAAPEPVPAASTVAIPGAAPAPAEDRLFADRAAWDAPDPWRTDRLYFQTAYYTWHFHYDANHKQSVTGDLTYRTDHYWL